MVLLGDDISRFLHICVAACLLDAVSCAVPPAQEDAASPVDATASVDAAAPVDAATLVDATAARDAAAQRDGASADRADASGSIPDATTPDRADAGSDAGGADAVAIEDAGTLGPPTGPYAITQFVDTYKLESWGACSRQDLTTLQNGTPHAPGIVGYAPTDPGDGYPLFIFTGGTFSDYRSPDLLVWLQEMASRGFVAASIEYDNSLPGGCDVARLKAVCAYDGSLVDSAMSVLCSRADANCARGVVTGGHSQGAGMALLARNHDMRIRATWMLGASCAYVWNQVDGLCNPAGTSDEKCLLDVNTAMSGQRMRIINGDRDEYGDQTSYQRLTGKVCPPDTLDCLDPDGSGWYRIPSSEVEDFHGPPDPDHTGWGADHCFWVNSTDGQWCPAPDQDHPPDVNWLPPASLTWSLGTNLSWLEGYVNQPNLPQKINAGSAVSHADFVRDQKQVNGWSAATLDAIDVGAAGAAPEAVYQSCAYTAIGQPGVLYTIDDLGASTSYLVRLHFAEIYYSAVGQRRFDVLINGTQFETDLDVVDAAGGARRALVRSYQASADAAGVITVHLMNGSVDAAMVSGVEVLELN